MSLPNKISTAVFTILDGVTTISAYSITVSNLDIPTSLKFWDGRSGLSITGKRRRKNIIRGFDREMSFQWEDVRNQETTILNLIESLKTATDNDYRIRFNASGSTDYIYVVPDEAVFNENYISQIKRTPTTISFSAETIRSDTGYD